MIAAIAFIVLTMLIYWGAKRVYRLKPIVLLSPIILAPIVVILILIVGRIPYAEYNAGGRWLTDMIGPATVALAVPFYKHLDVLKKHAFAIVAGTIGGSLIGFGAAFALARLLHLDHTLMSELMLRSTTTAFAIVVSNQIGGVAAVTAVIVMITGILGMVAGPYAIRAFRIRSDIAKGVVMGTSAHTAGATRAFQMGEVSGSIATISMMVAAFFTLIVVPMLV